ncbi:MAG TPA: hypothetical protein VK588_09715 [Chitinophagaceae bacterium]|nr:hypothetical protein [Chitinophagaceae bacterium]
MSYKKDDKEVIELFSKSGASRESYEILKTKGKYLKGYQPETKMSAEPIKLKNGKEAIKKYLK